MEAISKFDSLPPEVIKSHIFSFFSEKELILISRVSKVWNELSKDNLVWENKPLYKAHNYLTDMLLHPPISPNANHCMQVIEDHHYLKTVDPRLRAFNLYQAVRFGELEQIKAVYLHGFHLYPEFILVEAINSKQTHIVNFIFENFKEQIEINIIKLEEQKYLYANSVRNCLEIANRVFNGENIPLRSKLASFYVDRENYMPFCEGEMNCYSYD